MQRSSLYDEDILLWSEQQAEALRQLRHVRDLPNELDLENVVEEIESVGRSELASVESHLQNILVHLIKLMVEPDGDAVRHWRSEIVGFHGELLRRYSPSMRQRIDLDRLWGLARKLSMERSENPDRLAEMLPRQSPFLLDHFLTEDVGISELAAFLTVESPQSE